MTGNLDLLLINSGSQIIFYKPGAFYGEMA